MYCFTRIKSKTSLKGKTIALLGLTFKRDSDDTRDSLSFKFLQIMKTEFLKVITHDPFVDKKDLKDVLKKSDIVIIAVNHSYYEQFSAQDLAELAGKQLLVCDPWNICKTERFVFWTSEL
jgi:UDP-N-acetyl-D-mannosaminuronic acid dehydrogenase